MTSRLCSSYEGYLLAPACESNCFGILAKCDVLKMQSLLFLQYIKRTAAHVMLQVSTRTSPHQSRQFPNLPRPRVVPAILRRGVGLYSRVLNRHAVPDALLQHGDPVKLSHLVALCLRHAMLQPFGRGEALVVDESERLARLGHAVVLPLEVELLLLAQVGLVELPCAVDGPVAESAVAR